jgi:hypothetical protein
MSKKIPEVFAVGPPLVFKYKSTEVNLVNPSLIVGVELETENIRTAYTGTALGKCGFSSHTDNSLRGAAAEFISAPMPIGSLVEALKTYKELTKFDESNFSDRCSVHVHVNCTDLTTDNLASLALIYTVVEEILFEYVGHDRDNNLYCVPWNQCRNHLNLVTKFLNDGAYSVAKGWQKYTALNFLPLTTQGTVEFRHMYGTIDLETITTWLNIIGALFKYSTSTTSDDIIKEIMALNNTSQYKEFFHKVLAETLPYTDVYRHSLESGVIFAKYAMIKTRKEGEINNSVIRTGTVFDDLLRTAVEQEELRRGNSNWWGEEARRNENIHMEIGQAPLQVLPGDPEAERMLGRDFRAMDFGAAGLQRAGLQQDITPAEIVRRIRRGETVPFVNNQRG